MPNANEDNRNLIPNEELPGDQPEHGDPPFAVDITKLPPDEETPQPQDKPSGFPDLGGVKEYSDRARNKKIEDKEKGPKNRPSVNDVKRVEKAAEDVEKVAKGAQAVRRGLSLGRIVGEVASGAETGGVGFAAAAWDIITQAGQALKRFAKDDEYAELRQLIFFIATGLFLLSFLLLTAFQGAVKEDHGHFGPDGSGATLPIASANGAIIPAILAGDRGQVAGASIDQLIADRKKMSDLLAQHKLSLTAAQTAKAQSLLTQMAQLEPQLSSALSASESDPTVEQLQAKLVNQYRDLMFQLRSVVATTIAGDQASVISLVESHKITFTNVCQGAKSDIYQKRLSDGMYRALDTMARYLNGQGITLQINCLKSGHHPGTYHEAGQAVDINDRNDPRIPRLLMPFLHSIYDQEQAGAAKGQAKLLDIRQLFYNPLDNCGYNIPRGCHDSPTHIHLAVGT